jgi:hypothetical protein
VAHVPAAHELLRLAALSLGQRHRRAIDLDPVPQHHRVLAVLADRPGLDAARRAAEGLGDPGAEPQRIVQGVAEHAPAVEPGALLNPGAQRVDGVGDDQKHPRPPIRQRVGYPGHDLRVVPEVHHPRLVDGERRRGGDDDHVGAGQVLGAALANRAARVLLEHLLEVPEVGEHHLAAAVQEGDVGVVGRGQQVECDRRSNSSAASCDRHVHRRKRTVRFAM